MKKLEYQLGDRVRVVATAWSGFGKDAVGKTGTVDRIDPDEMSVMLYRVAIDDTPFPRWFPATCLEAAA